LLRSALAADVLDRVKEQSPAFFEQLVLDVLRAMGYGGTHEDAMERLGQSGDEGVDGVIREDELGLDLIYVQAKRWQNPVGRPEIQKFFGALHGKRASKGVFITTSSFTGDAVAYADSVTPRIILVDGRELGRLMIDYGVGVTTARRYEIRRIDLDYFASDDEAMGESPAVRDRAT
jgi:restriction system protein